MKARAHVATLPRKDEETGKVISIEEITPFDNDPRQSPNPEYTRIKASIRANGLDQPLVVTRRPGDTRYIVAAGGNTRLKILSELFKEEGDQQFARVTCVVKPWRGESEVLLAHLRENDLRGDLTFFDKAQGVGAVRRLLESEQGQVTLTHAALAEQLKSRGYALSQASISNMEYTVNVLTRRIPQALRAGLPHTAVIRIRTFENAARALWHARVPSGSADNFEDVFDALCRRYDGPDWDALSLRQAFEAEIADRLNQTVHAVRLALDARLNGVTEVELPARDEDDDGWPEQPTPAAPKLRLQSNESTVSEPRPTTLRGEGKEPTINETVSVDTQVTVPTGNAGETRRAKEPERLDDIPSMRTQLSRLAGGIAKRHGMEALIVATPEIGAGYLVTDVPDRVLLAQFDEDGLAQVSMIWWQLMAFAEMTVAPTGFLLSRLASDSVLHRALRDQDAALLFNAVWTLDPGQIGFRLWRTIGDADWDDLRTMALHYRTLHRMAAQAGVSLWQAPR